MVSTTTSVGNKRPRQNDHHILPVDEEGQIVATFGIGSPPGRPSTHMELVRRGASMNTARRAISNEGKKIRRTLNLSL